jgi:DNA polymerase III alpha subunit
MGNKVKEYKVEAERCDIKVNRVDINNSGWTFEIVGEEIYMGFSNIKGIGEEIAQRIVASQPYSSFEDFLTRFGTDAKVLKPLIGLNLFEKDGDRKTLYEFYEYYKDKTKKRENRNIRNKKSRSGIVDEFRYLLYNEYKDQAEKYLKDWSFLEDKDIFLKFCNNMLEDVDSAWKTCKKYKRNVEGIMKKMSEDEDIVLSSFVPTGEINPKVNELYDAIPQTAEREFYGFAWDHILEYSKDYRGGYSFDGFEDETKIVLPIEAQIVEKTQQKMSKKGTVYYIATIEDANGVTNRVTIWEEDYLRFKEEFEYWDEENSFGNLIRVKLERPGPGFRSFTFDSPPKYLRHKVIPEDKGLDGRLMVLAFPEMVKEKKSIVTKPQEQEILIIDEKSGLELDIDYLESL